MKTYHIYRTPSGVKVDVLEEVLNGTKVEDIHSIRSRPLKHVVKHSPTGFEFGYSGSGPAELARCILLDAGYALEDVELCYQRFKEFFISRVGHDTKEFFIYQDGIEAWWEQRHGGSDV